MSRRKVISLRLVEVIGNVHGKSKLLIQNRIQVDEEETVTSYLRRGYGLSFSLCNLYLDDSIRD
jgi:hypothetical protein